MYTRMGVYKKLKSMGRRAAQAVKKRYKAKPGGRKSTGGVRVAKMAKDIMYLKSVLNPEKKRFPTLILDKPVGQVNGNGDGGYFEDVTPLVPQGVTAETRNGASIKLHSSIYHFQFKQQPSTLCRIRGCIEIWAMDGDSYPAASFAWRDEHFMENTFSGVRDLNCQLDPDNFMKGRLVARRNFSTATDSLGNENLVTDVKIPIKYNRGKGHHVRYAKDSTVNVQHGQLYLVIRTDRGNCSTSSVSTRPVPDVGINTGLTMNYNKMDYFYDN